jgi:hypothetical protein
MILYFSFFEENHAFFALFFMWTHGDSPEEPAEKTAGGQGTFSSSASI